MKRQIVCENGHYYDASLDSCPICENNTLLLDVEGNISAEIDDNQNPVNNKTMYMENIEEKEKVKEVILAGWLIIISDKGKGESFPITFGFNSIGRDSKNDIAIINQDNSISREKHASIIYDYSNNVHFIKHEDGKFLTYLNGGIVLETKQLNSFDKIRVGNTELLFVALCGESFKWEL